MRVEQELRRTSRTGRAWRSGIRLRCGRSFAHCCRTGYECDEKSYYFEGDAAVGKLFNGLVHIERSGVPNGI